MTQAKPKFTAPVKRGLATIRELFIDGMDDDKPPFQTLVQSLSKPQERELNRALEWIEHVEATLAEPAQSPQNETCATPANPDPL